MGYRELVNRAEGKIDSSPFAHLREMLLERLVPSIGVWTAPTTMDNLPRGASRLAGDPDLPPGFEWPSHTPPPLSSRDLAAMQAVRMPPAIIATEQARRDGSKAYSLAFLAQFDLSEVARSIGPIWRPPLPDRGWLYFFHDPVFGGSGDSPDELGGFLVTHHDGPSAELVRTKSPESSSNESWRVTACRFEFAMMLPSFGTRAAGSLPIDWIERGQREAYRHLVDAVDVRPGPHHRLLGYPEPVQPTPLDTTCHVVRALGRRVLSSDDFPEESRAWTHLLQLDSASSTEDAPGWMWGDMGRLYYFARGDDLAASRFDRCHRIEQCC